MEVQDVEFTEVLNEKPQDSAVTVIEGTGEVEKPEAFMAHNFAVSIAKDDPILQNEYVKRFVEVQVAEYVDPQEDGSILFPLQHTDVAYFLHLIYVSSGKPVYFILDGLLYHTEEDGTEFQVQVAKLTFKD